MKNIIQIAEWIAKEAHYHQKRRYTGEPYFTHCYNVARGVAKLVQDQEMIAAAFLHDTVEDTSVTIDEIGEIFGERVAGLVYDLTDHFTPENYPHMNRAKRKALEAKRLGTIHVDAKLIKWCDLADNTANIVAHDPGFAKIYLVEKAQVLKEMGF